MPHPPVRYNSKKEGEGHRSDWGLGTEAIGDIAKHTLGTLRSIPWGQFEAYLGIPWGHCEAYLGDNSKHTLAYLGDIAKHTLGTVRSIPWQTLAIIGAYLGRPWRSVPSAAFSLIRIGASSLLKPSILFGPGSL